MDNWNDFIQGVRKNKAQLLETYGGLEGLFKHQEEDRSRLESEGWKFVSFEEMCVQNRSAVADFTSHNKR